MNNFETIYKDNYRKMFCVGQKMINDIDAVSDILQDVFINYYQKSQNGHPIQHPPSWLMKATINKCIDYSVHRKRYTKIDTLEPNLTKDTIDEGSQAEAVIKLALSKLKPKEKALALLYSEGISYTEIAEITGIKFSSVGKTLSRTLKKLNEILKKLNYEMY